jgi:hypothetical protein
MPSEGVEPLTLTVTIPLPGKLVSLNENMHWGRQQQAKSTWQQAGWVVASQARTICRERRLVSPLEFRARVQLHAGVVRDQRRDGHNFAPTAKWFIDGLVLGKLLVDDDTSHLELADWTFEVMPSYRRTFTMTLTEAR